MNENSQRVGQIMEALRLTENGNNMYPGQPGQTPVYTITGEARQRLIAELVNLLAPTE